MLLPVSANMPKRALPLMIATLMIAQANQAIAEEEKIIVTGQTVTADSIIDQEALDNFQATDLEDIFRHSPEVNVGGGFSTGQKIYVRGIEDTNLNVSIDGAQQAGYLFHHQGRVSIEPELLKQVEVQAGAGVATDGPGALGGAIRFITKDPEDLLRENETFGGLVKLGYFDNTEGFKAHSSLFGRASDNVSILASLTRQDTNNIVDGNGNEQTNTASEIDSALFKLVGHIDENQTVRISHDFRDDDGVRNLRPHFVSAGWNQANKQESHRDTTNIQYNMNPDNGVLDLQANVYHTDAYITQQATGSDKDGAGVKSTGFDIRNTQQLDNHKLTYGIDYRKDTGYYINPSNTGPTQNEVVHVAGLYIQDQISVTDQLTVNTGARFDHYDMDDNIGQNFTSSGLSPNLGLSYAINDALTIHGGYASALRGVVVKEAYLLNYATNDAGREEERAHNLEVGFDYHQGSLSYGATAYVGLIEDAVTRSGSVLNNSGDVKNKGITAYVGYNWENTDLHLAYSYNRPELDGLPIDDGDMSIGTSTGDTLTASLTHMLPQHDLEMGWSAQLVQRLTDLPAGRAEKAGYGVHDVYAKWYPQGHEDMSLTLTVKNLLDKQYLSHASYGVSTSSGNLIGLEEAGRDIRLTFASRF